MEKVQFKLSYNRSKATANWVSWHLDPSWTGTTPRQDDFRADNTLPAGWYQAGSTSYSGSGFDRGHNCPSADRTASVADNSETFLMTNMIPQAPVNNQQTWANLEAYGRTLVGQGNEVYIIMGCYGVGGTGSAGSANTINNGNITVPSNIWKVLVVLAQGTNDVGRVTTSTRVIAVNTPNLNTTGAWGTYRTSVDAIEAATGYDILSNVSTSIQATIEATVDNGPTQ
jgi:endonuclease G